MAGHMAELDAGLCLAEHMLQDYARINAEDLNELAARYLKINESARIIVKFKKGSRDKG